MNHIGIIVSSDSFNTIHRVFIQNDCVQKNFSFVEKVLEEHHEKHSTCYVTFAFPKTKQSKEQPIMA